MTRTPDPPMPARCGPEEPDNPPERLDYTAEEREALLKALEQFAADVEYAAEDWQHAIRESNIPPDLRPSCKEVRPPSALPKGYTLNQTYEDAMHLVCRLTLAVKKLKEGKL